MKEAKTKAKPEQKEKTIEEKKAEATEIFNKCSKEIIKLGFKIEIKEQPRFYLDLIAIN